MTSKSQLKSRIRARMAHTGESYTTARRHVVADSPDPAPAATVDGGYPLLGGTHPDSSAVAHVLASLGAVADDTGKPVNEALVLGIGGGLGAGYILWEFRQRDLRTLVLGFRNQWQYPGRWMEKTAARLGVPLDVHQTTGRTAAAARLTEELDAGRPAVVWPDRQLVGYWHLPSSLEAYGGHPVIAYRQTGGRVALDDRNLATLTVPREQLDVARARVVSYKNVLYSLRPQGPIDAETLRTAVRAGLRDQVDHLASSSDSFGPSAWRKWARLLTDTRNAKAWPNVFADGRGLVGALLSVWEGIEPAGMTGGNLRAFYADFLDEAAVLLGKPALAGCATRYRDAADAWHALAEIALPASVPELARARELTAAVAESITAEGDAGRDEAATASAELWELRGKLDRSPPFTTEEVHGLFARLGDQLHTVYEAEVAAHAGLAKAAEAA